MKLVYGRGGVTVMRAPSDYCTPGPDCHKQYTARSLISDPCNTKMYDESMKLMNL